MQRFYDREQVGEEKNIVIIAIISPASEVKLFYDRICSRFSSKFKSIFYTLPQHQASTSKKVYLKAVTLKSTGVYRCEISAEEPDFKTVQGEGKLEVVCEYKRCAFLVV